MKAFTSAPSFENYSQTVCLCEACLANRLKRVPLSDGEYVAESEGHCEECGISFETERNMILGFTG